MATPEELSALAQAQAALVRSLTTPAAPPPGFDTHRVTVSAQALVKKRIRTVARAWPRLTAALGDQYETRFQAYALRQPLPRHGGPLADGYGFARFLKANGELPEAGRWEIFVVELGHVLRPDGLHPRRGFYVQAARFPQLHLLALAAKIPWLASRIFTLTYGAGTTSRPAL